MTLSDLRIDEAPERKHIFAFEGTVLSFDQSLAHTGWAQLVFHKNADHGVAVWSIGSLDSKEPISGHEAAIKRSVFLHNQLHELLMDFRDRTDIILCEMPPVANRMMRPESSLLAASMLRLAASRAGFDVGMISAQKTKKIWTGNANAKKDDIKRYLLEWWPEIAGKPYTPDQIDAIANGLAWVELNPNREKDADGTIP